MFIGLRHLPWTVYVGLLGTMNTDQNIENKSWSVCDDQQSIATVCSVSSYFTVWAEVSYFNLLFTKFRVIDSFVFMSNIVLLTTLSYQMCSLSVYLIVYLPLSLPFPFQPLPPCFCRLRPNQLDFTISQIQDSTRRHWWFGHMKRSWKDQADWVKQNIHARSNIVLVLFVWSSVNFAWDGLKVQYICGVPWLHDYCIIVLTVLL